MVLAKKGLYMHRSASNEVNQMPGVSLYIYP